MDANNQEFMPEKVRPSRGVRMMRRGTASILALVALPVLLVFTWFCIEYARIHRHAGRAKLAADAAALAAAARYADGPDVARSDAIAAAAGHEGPSGPLVLVVAEGPAGGGDLEFGDWDPQARIFTPNPDGGKAARATVRLAEGHPNGGVALLYSGLFDITPATVVQTSIALFRPPTHTTSLLLADPSASSLALAGSAVLRGRGGISVANDDAGAVTVGDGASLDVPIVRAAGTVDDDDEARVDGEVEEGATVPADPFAGVEVPPIDLGAPVAETEVDPDARTMLAPGVHGALAASAGTVVLLPGLHQFRGGISMSGTAAIEFDGATIQLAPGVALELSDAAALRGTPDSSDQQWGGCAIIQRPGQAEWSLSGSAHIAVAGRIYAPGTRITASGASFVGASSAVLRAVSFAGSSSMRLDADIDEVQLPGASGRARLVR